MTPGSEPPKRRWREPLAFALLGALAFAVFVLVRLPASALEPLARRSGVVQLASPTGTVWRGDAGLSVNPVDLGRLRWRLTPGALLAFADVHWELRHPEFQLQGVARHAWRSASGRVTGVVDAVALNRALGKYHIRLGGKFPIDHLRLRVVPSDGATPSVWQASGQLRWTGGRTNYRLSGRSFEVDFPSLFAKLTTTSSELRFKAFLDPDGAGVPLLEARLDVDGWLHISVTRRFTRLAGKPWPGTRGDDEVVVTVAERVWPAANIAFAPFAS